MSISIRTQIRWPVLTFILTCALFLVTPATAVIEETQFDDPILEQRYQDLIAELRCLVCQNQNLADSDADLAKDLRRKTAEMLRAGDSDEEILEYMRERYGDFVLYRPPFNLSNAILWIGPFLLLFLVAVVLLVRIRRRQLSAAQPKTDELGDEQRQKIRELLENEIHNDHSQ
ncbi:MAG: cytochrome c-type biogenesis protein [Pseudomonadota bacterium]